MISIKARAGRRPAYAAMQPRHLAYAAQSAPRYTSYPTAPHFHRGVDGEVFRGWLGLIQASSSLSIYVHVPYCRELCHYCGCHTFLAGRNETLESYIASLKQEIALMASAVPARRVAYLRWGGGTPNILSPDQFEELFQYLDATFDLNALDEHAIELDPRHLTADQARLYGVLGVHRASLGIQDFNAHVQKAVGREQSEAVIAEAVAHLRAAGIRRLGLDLMYGLPHQTLEDVKRSARKAAALRPNRIAVFGYAHVPWFKSRQRLIDENALPGLALRYAQAEAIREELLVAGYDAVGLDHYAQPEDSLAQAARWGSLRRNFNGYVDDERVPLIGLGASAISTLPQGYAQNASEVGAWRHALTSGVLPTARGYALTEEDRQRGRIIESLLCAFAVDLGDYGGASAFDRELEALRPLICDGLAVLSGDEIVIPEPVRPLARVVAEIFDAYRHTQPARHSSVV